MTKRSEAMLWVRQMQNPKYIGKRGRVPRYAAIHIASSLNAPWQAKSGDPHWFQSTAKWAAKNHGKKIRGHIQQFISSGSKDKIDVWVRKFERRNNKLENGVMKTPSEVARESQMYARGRAPQDTGALIQAISWRTTRKQ